MFHYFFNTREWALWAYGGGAVLIISLWLQVQLTVGINGWYGDFYNLLQDASSYHDNPEEGIRLFFQKLGGLEYLTGSEEVAHPSFFVLATPHIVLATFVSWFTSIYGLRWREAMTFGFIPRWRNVEEEIEGASQRIQEDCNRFARIVESLGLQIVRAIMTLVAFIPILWGFSDKVDVPVLRDIAGSLVWGALLVSLGGLAISWFVGIKLPGLEYNNQKVEAAFRKDLVLGEDDKYRYAQPETLFSLFTGIRFNYHRLYLHYGYFNLWLNSYDQFMVIVPYLVMGPSLFIPAAAGGIALGLMVQVSNAFQRVHGGFALFLHNWTTITELRSIYKRLHEFEANLKKYEKPHLAPAD